MAVWLVIAVSTCQFTFFIAVHVLRRHGGLGATAALPHQLWLGTAWLLAAAQLLRVAIQAARLDLWPRCRALWLAGGASTALFLACQLWAWQDLQGAQLSTQGSTATGMFCLLTGVHGPHVLGGLMTWAAAAPMGAPSGTRAGVWRLALCVHCWHFLPVVWLVLHAVPSGVLTGGQGRSKPLFAPMPVDREQ